MGAALRFGENRVKMAAMRACRQADQAPGGTWFQADKVPR